MSNIYYLQDNRGYVGNDILWWAKEGKGYTTDLSKAETYTKEQAMSQHQSRGTDIPWPKDYIDAKSRPAVDMQYVDIDIALQGTGIELIKPQRQRKEVFNCHGCGQFMNATQVYSDVCNHCGADNRP